MISNDVFSPQPAHSLISNYLETRDWQLLTAEQVMAQLPKWLLDQAIGHQLPKKIIRWLWQLYGITLHDFCRKPSAIQHNHAWTELRQWLMRRGSRLIRPNDLENVVQETLIRLMLQLYKRPLTDPKTIWAYATRTLRSTAIDYTRQQNASKRGSGLVLSLEQLQYGDDENEADWEEWLVSAEISQRQTETKLMIKHADATLRTLFAQHLTTEQQQQVAIAYFLYDMQPKEIADAMKKPSHQIRLTKARIVKKLQGKKPLFVATLA